MSIKIKENKKTKGEMKVALSKEQEQEYIKKVKKNPFFLKEIEDQTEAMCLEAVERNGSALKYVKKQTPELCFKAVKEDGWALEYIEKQTSKICLEALKEEAYVLGLIGEKTKEMKLTSLFNDFESYDSDEFEHFYEMLDTDENEINSIYKLLERWDCQLPSYQTVRLKLAVGEIELNQSPYHVLEQLYYH